ncbi:MAG: hypothetical protein QOC92_1839 [Acidimicrobiaceae bacterium]|jgi:hypothetical protein
MEQPQAGIEIKASFLVWLYFTLYLFPPKITIDGGQPIGGKWGDNLIPVAPGNHTVTVYWPLYWFLPSNKATISVDVPAGQVAQIEYKPAFLFFLPGKIKVLGTRPMAPGQAA